MRGVTVIRQSTEVGRGKEEGLYKARGLTRLTIRCKISYEDILYNTGNINSFIITINGV